MSHEPIELERYVRPGDTIWWNQGTAEPLSLTESLVRQRAAVGPCRAFLGVNSSTTLQAEHADYLSLLSYCGLGRNQPLLEAGMLDVVPCHYSQLPSMLDNGVLPCDVMFLHVSPPGPDGKSSLGTAHDYLLSAARRARVVIAEINEQMPWTYGAHGLEEIHFDAVVHSSRPLLETPVAVVGQIEQRIAEHAAGFIEDGSVLEMGIGAVPDAILGRLADRRDLGVHSGMLGDSIVGLIESGAVTNARKSIDAGLTTVGILLGTQRLYKFARTNASLNFQPGTYTHAHSVLAKIDNFVAINSAIEVDLTGQINAEVLNGRYMGAIGGQTDFMRGALAARNGRSIIALPSSARNGGISRIVSRLADSVVTTPRSEADIFVTEWGAAQLRGQPLQERMRRMIAIAHPDHREQLEREAFALKH